MATGAVLTYTGKNHTYVITDANTSLPANDRTLSNPGRYTISVDGAVETRTHTSIRGALHRLREILGARDYF